MPEREALVLDAAVAGTRDAAARAKVAPLPKAPCARVFAAQLGGRQAGAVADACAIPRFVLEQPIPDLDKQLRPALLRIGEQIGALLVSLPPDQDDDALRAAARDGLRTPRLSPDSVAGIAEALAKLEHARTATPRAR